MENDDIFDGLGVEITLKTKEDFLKVKETLTRIGISSRTDKKLWQSCHILHKRGKYAIMHFKEMFVLDGLSSDISDEDLGRRNVIVKLLVEWGLIDAVDEEEYKEPMIPLSKLKIISHKEKGDWQLIPKYHIGRK
jgi:Bacteriophage translational regulator